MKRSTRNKVRTMKEIIEKSAPVFNMHGYAGTSMQMLVDATGYQMGGIYRHFGTKKNLAKAVFTYTYRVLIRENLNLSPVLNPKQKLQAIIGNYLKMVVRPAVPGGCPLLNTAVEMDDTDEEFRKIVKTSVEEIIQIVEGILVEGKVQGLFQESIDEKREASFLFASFEGAILLGKTTRSAAPVIAIFEHLSSYLERCVFKP